MGNTFLRYIHPVEREVHRLREDLIDRFEGQQFLILGPPGCGKSSLVNSFNYVINLTNPQADYDEIAQVGASTGEEAKTKKLTKYDYKKNMYAKLRPDQRKDAPVFFDLMGLPNQAALAELISKLADGKIDDGTDMMRALSTDDSSYRENLGREHRELQRPMAAWAIIFVLSVRAFPDGLVEDVREAIEMVDELKERTDGLRIFAFITKVDRVSEDKKGQKIAEVTEKFQTSMNVPLRRIVPIINFTDEDLCKATGKYRPNREKQLLILRAFDRILTHYLNEPFKSK